MYFFKSVQCYTWKFSIIIFYMLLIFFCFSLYWFLIFIFFLMFSGKYGLVWFEACTKGKSSAFLPFALKK